MLLTLGVPFELPSVESTNYPQTLRGVEWECRCAPRPLPHLWPRYFRTSKHFHHEVPLPCPFYCTNKGK